MRALKWIAYRLPVLGRILARRDAAFWEAVRQREVAEAERWAEVKRRETAEVERWAEVKQREAAHAERAVAARQRDEAEAARWEAIRQREAVEAELAAAIRQREEAEAGRWEAVRQREAADAERALAIKQREDAERQRAAAGTAARLQLPQPSAIRWRDRPHLEKQGLFVFGQTRSGTTVLTRALNTCPDIFLLSEANIHIEGTRRGFARWFNGMHDGLGGTHTKGTYCPVAPDEDADASETFDWLSQRYRYVGDKIAFRGEKLGYDPENLFDFHARHFFASHYVCVIRNPADVMKSNQEMFKPKDLWLYADSYLQALLLILAFAETLPNVYVLFHESINQRTFDVLGKELKVDLSGIYEANYGKHYQVTELWGRDHSALPWLMILGTAYQMMRDAFSLETLRETPNHPTWMMLAPWIRELREKLQTSGPERSITKSLEPSGNAVTP